jgi:hypothetical protein
MLIIDVNEVKSHARPNKIILLPECGKPVDGGAVIAYSAVFGEGPQQVRLSN